MGHDGTSAPLRIQLLGGFQVMAAGRALTAADLRLRAAQQLIKLLALAPDYRLHREQVLAALWPDQEPQAAVNSLNQALFVARRALATPDQPRSAYLLLRDQLLRLGEPAAVSVDVAIFEQAASAARRSQRPADVLAALALYRGDLLPDDPYDAWLDARRAALRQSFRALALTLAAQAEGTPAAEPAVAALQQALAGDLADEELHRALMRLYARTGARQQAIRQYQLLQRALRHDLDLEPDPLSTQLYQAILDGQIAPVAPAPAAPRHNLPVALTSFVGRARELAEVRRLLASTRLLTIAGVGGGGKTRLAIEAARGLQADYPDGVWLVELAALTNPALLPQVVATAIGLRESQGVSMRDQLIDELRARHMLLLLDNCEHLIDACAALVELLLQRCPDLRVLATSREPLRIGGEVTWLIPALALPDPRQPLTLADLPQHEALQLFVDRASALGQLQLRAEDLPTLAQICARLDGLPLAIELAAARVPTLSLAQIAARLDDRFQLLRGGSRTALTRQQTLRAAIDWSYDLLDAQERRLFRRLAVFAGGWTLEAAEAICAGDGLERADLLTLLAQLVEQSLVVVRGGAERRYELLETIRQYALEQLRAAGEEPSLRQRHQDWYLQLADQGRSELTGPRQVAWLQRLTTEHDNLRAALEWTASATAQDVPWLRLAYSLYWFWYLSSAVGEGRAWFERALAQREPDDRSWARGVALLGSGAMALYQGELRTARSRLDASLPILRAGDDQFSQALAPFMAGTVAINQGDYQAAQPLLEESLPRFQALSHWQGIGIAQLHLGDVALGLGDPQAAEARYAASLAIHRAHHSTWGMAQALNNLGEVARYQGDLARAAEHYHAALELFRQLATQADVARTLHNLGLLALADGDPALAEAHVRESIALFRAWGNCRGIVEGIAGLALVRATRPAQQALAASLLGFAAGHFSRSGAVVWPPDQLAVARAQAALAAQLGAAALADAAARGQAMTLEQALEQALADITTHPAAVPV